MESSRWDAIRAQFDQLADLDEPARREQLAVLATSDPSLRRDVELLLHADLDAEERLTALFTPLGLGGDAGERLTRHVSTEGRQRLEEALSGAYRIEGEMTGGGSSRVFAAVEVALGRHVVIKLLPPELAEAVSVDRFRRECLLVAQLQHPHIVPLLAAGTAADFLYYTMPLVEGESLRQRLERDGALPIADAIGILREIADALDYASTHGVVHRDVKPGNVMLSAGHALLTDFGIAKALDRPSDATTLTSPALAIGTPTYMAPEQASGAPVDHRTDLYALGVLGYEMLAGEPPFSGDGVREVLLAHVVAIPEPISARRLDVPVPLAALIMRCLSKEPIDRPQSAREVYDALVSLGAGGTLVALGAPAPSKAPGKGEQLAPGRPTASKGHAIAAPDSAPRFLTMAAPVAVVAVVAVVAAVALNRRPAVSPPVLDEHRLLIAPFRNESGDSTLDALGTMVADWLTRGVVETGLADPLAARVSRRRDGSVVAGELEGPALLPQARAQAARRIVSGSYYATGDSLQFHARITDASDARTLGSVAPAVVWRGNPMLAIDAIRTRVIGALASMNPTEVGGIVSADAPPSFAAYREFLRGEEEFSRGAFEQSIVHDRNALALDSNYLAPMVRMVYAHFNLQQCAQAESLGRVLRARRDKLPAYEGFYLDRGLAWCAGDVNAAYRAAKQMLAVSPHASYASTSRHVAPTS
ncbi:MAG: protein kinase [Gemmatimonadetes bacterium]|nr:protein kinase [Gemmatimonadota bacterium]